MYKQLAFSIALVLSLTLQPESRAFNQPTPPPTAPTVQDVNTIIEKFQQTFFEWVQEIKSEKDPQRVQELIAQQPNKTATATELLNLAKSAGQTPAAFQAQAWVYLECSDEAYRTQSLDQLMQHWATSPEMLRVLPGLERDPNPRARAGLERLSQNHDQQSIALTASVSLASWLIRFDLENSKDQAIELLQNIANSQTTLPHLEGGTLKEAAQSQLFSVQNLALGTVIPEIAGQDLKGVPFKLSDYRGQVVLVTYWAHWCSGCMAQAVHERALVEDYQNRPFTIIGINCDPGPPAEVLAQNRQKRITWRSFQNDAQNQTFGSIALKWNIRTLPTTYLIDTNGTILKKWEATAAPPNELRTAVEKAVATAEARAQPDANSNNKN